jgi:hypothetical protein
LYLVCPERKCLTQARAEYNLFAWLAAWVVTLHAALILVLLAAVLGVKAPLPDGGGPQAVCPGRQGLLQ